MSTTAAVASSSVTLAQLIDSPDATQARLAEHLDALDSETRVRECRALSGKQQKRLWQICAGAPAFTLEDLVPPPLGEGRTVIYAGKNSLPAFTLFEKRFMRKKGQVIGYNHQATSWITGPGYFTCETSPKDAREILFDYTRVPSETPTGWPQVKPNKAGFSRFVYNGLHDFNRRVSKDVLIGSATRLGKDIDSYYVLCRT
jgi:hypothetical protein